MSGIDPPDGPIPGLGWPGTNQTDKAGSGSQAAASARFSARRPERSSDGVFLKYSL